MTRLTEPIADAAHQEVGGLQVDAIRAGNGRMLRTIYPPGWRWSTHMQPVSGTPSCMHTHLGFLAQGHIAGVYEDGCEYDVVAPQFAIVEAGHDTWVVGDEPAVFISWDSEEGTARRFGLPERHGHG